MSMEIMNFETRPQRKPLVFLDIAIDSVPAGRVVIELRSDIVPKTAENFRSLCTGENNIGINNKPLHFKGTKFHRAIAQFMVQGGDIINGDGSGGESIYGPLFDDENFKLKHNAGVLSMANTGEPNTNSSQFCITTVPCPHLDGTNVVFGEVLAGLGIIKEIQRYGDKDTGRPKVDCVIQDCGEIVTNDWNVCCRDGTTDQLPEHPSDYKDDHINVDQLITSIRDVKSSGNLHFREGRYKAAARKYHKCLRYLEHLCEPIDALNDINMKKKFEDIRNTYTLQCNLNLAACYTKLEDYKSTVNFCTAVLEQEPRNEKALYRRGQANFALKNYDDALSDLKQADKVSPNNKAVNKLLGEVRLTNKCYNDVQKQRLSKFFRDQKEETFIQFTDN